MELAHIWVAGKIYSEGSEDSTIPKMPHTKVRDDTIHVALGEGCRETTRMLQMMAVCNTVVPSQGGYEAESPDECAFVWGAKALGYELAERVSPKDISLPMCVSRMMLKIRY